MSHPEFYTGYVTGVLVVLTAQLLILVLVMIARTFI